MAAAYPNFELVIRETSVDGRLSPSSITERVENLKDMHVLYCGPAALRKALWEGLKGNGLSARRFHNELFEIKTGVGLQYLLNYILERAKPVRK